MEYLEAAHPSRIKQLAEHSRIIAEEASKRGK